MNLEYGQWPSMFVLMAVMPADLRLVTRSTISDTKGDTAAMILWVYYCYNAS